MSNGYTDDMYQYDMYDDYHADHKDDTLDAEYERLHENLQVFGENNQRGWQGRLELGEDLDGLDGSDFTLDEDGNIRPCYFIMKSDIFMTIIV